MTLSDILARADEPVWRTSVMVPPSRLSDAIKGAPIGHTLYQECPPYGMPRGFWGVGRVTQELLDAVEARDE